MGSNHAERIIGALEEADGPLTDAQLAAALMVGHPTVDQTCCTLQQHGCSLASSWWAPPSGTS